MNDTESSADAPADLRPDLSIVIVGYESRHLLEPCLASLAAAAGELAWETLVVDNDSRDGTIEWLAAAHPAIRRIANAENRGFARAANQGLRAARGRFLLLLNPDTVAAPGVFAATVRYLEAHPRIGAASCRVLRPDGRLDPSCKRSFPSLFDAFARFTGLSRLFPRVRRFTRYDALHLDEHVAQEVPLIDGCYMMIRGAALADIGLLDERFFMYAEEMDWCRRAHAKGWGIGYDPSGSIVHLKGETTRRHTFRMLYQFHRSMALYCLKHRRWFDPAILVILPGIVARYVALTVLNLLRRERRVSG